MRKGEEEVTRRRLQVAKTEGIVPIHIGPELMERDEWGHVKSRVGTVFLKTPGLVTEGKIHALQRAAWVDRIQEDRQKAGLPLLSEGTAESEMNESVDLLMDDTFVYIRPDPRRPELTAQADEYLQTHTNVSKARIRYLNIAHPDIRKSLRERGELWRMMPQPISVGDMIELINHSRIALDGMPIYYYNQSMGVRYVTPQTFRTLQRLPDKELREHLLEIKQLLTRRNRFQSNEVAFFPKSCPFDLAAAFTRTDIAGIKNIRAHHKAWADEFERATPEILREDDPANEIWRNAMCEALSIQGNPTTTTEELFKELSPEFFRQILWLPGASFLNNEIHYDPIFNEPSPPPNLQDPRARAIVHSYARQFRNIAFINVGRIQQSLSRDRPLGEAQHAVYIVELKLKTFHDLNNLHDPGPPPLPRGLHTLRLLRFIKWGPAERLNLSTHDKPVSFEQAIRLSDEYTEFILDRRLGCLQFGMNLPDDISVHRIRDIYKGRGKDKNQDGINLDYIGQPYWATYITRPYVAGTATDKIPPHYYKIPAFAPRLARLLGAAAAINLVIGRASSLESPPQRALFDDGDEVLQLDPLTLLPQSLIVSDPTGAFAHYFPSLYDFAHHYAKPVNSRLHLLPDPRLFARVYLKNIAIRLQEMRDNYRVDKPAYDALFAHLPIDPNGNIRYRWDAVLKRLLDLDIPRLILHIESAIELPTELIRPNLAPVICKPQKELPQNPPAP